ncbi:MAG: hypothetical protein HY986_19100 [Candidatus Melainabacteria bacterium]|nr:hypothetical protein [Candidatus Melainabacteria bacterium]
MAEDAVKPKDDKAPEKPKAAEAAAVNPEKDANAKLQADAGHVPPPSDAGKAAGADNKSPSTDAKGTDGKTADGKAADGKAETGEKAKTGDDKAEGNKEGEQRTAAELACEMWDCLKKDYLDAKSRVKGLMGFALHPEMAKSGKPLEIAGGKSEILAANGTLDFSVPAKSLTGASVEGVKDSTAVKADTVVAAAALTPQGNTDSSQPVTAQETETPKPESKLESKPESKPEDTSSSFSFANFTFDLFPDTGTNATSKNGVESGDLKLAATPDVSKQTEGSKPEDKAWYETGMTGAIWDFGKSTFQSVGDVTYSIYKGSGLESLYNSTKEKFSPIWDSYSDEFATSLKDDGKKVSDVVSALKNENGVVVETVKKDGVVESCKIGDANTCWSGSINPRKFEHTTADGVSIVKDGRNYEISLKGGDKVNITNDRGGVKDQVITKTNGDTVRRLQDGTYELYDKANDITTRVKNSQELEKTYGQTFAYAARLAEDSREVSRDYFRQMREGRAPGDPGILNRDSRLGVEDYRNGKGVNNGESIAIMSQSNELTIIKKDGSGGARISGDQVQLLDAHGEPIPGRTVSTREFLQQNANGFGGWRINADASNLEAVDVEGRGRIRLNRATEQVTASQTATTGVDAGKTVQSATNGDDKRVVEFKGPDDKPIQTTTIDPRNPERGVVEQTAGEQGHRVFDMSNPADIKYKEYTSQDENPKTLKYELGEHSSYFDGATVNHDTGTVYYDSPSGGRYTVYSSSPESYASATSAANSASSHGSSVASQVNAAVSAGNFTSDAYRGLAIGAIANVDAAIQQCMVTGNFEGFGNLISTKDRLINALNSLNDKSNKFDDASKLGLSTEQAKYVAENTGNGSLHKAIEEVKIRANGRKPESW